MRERYQAGSERSNAFWDRSTIVVDGNKNLAKAQVICLGEVHYDAFQNLAIQRCIKKYSNPGDIVLIEGVAKMTEVKPSDIQFQTYNFHRALKVMGWEDPTLYRYVSEKLYGYMRTSRLLKAINVLGNPKHDVLSASQWTNNQKRVSEINDSAIAPRNKYMQKAISESRELYPNAKIFVIAGMAHFFRDQDPDLFTFLSEFDYSVVNFAYNGNRMNLEPMFRMSGSH